MFFLSVPSKYKHALQQVQCDFPTKITINEFDDRVLDITVDEADLLVMLALVVQEAS
jgi:hypothetical protein